MTNLKNYNTNKVFVRNIKKEDQKELNNILDNICSKYFIFGKKNTRSAICCFKNEKDVNDFIATYNNKKIGNSNIKCEYALKKKSEYAKLAPLIYNSRKVVTNNCLEIIINYDFEITHIFSFLNTIYLQNLDVINRYVYKNKKQNEQEKNENVEDKEGEFEIDTETKDNPLEKFIVSIKKKNKKGKKKNKKKADKDKTENEKKTEEKEDSVIYVIEFINCKLAKLYSQWINKDGFENFLKENNIELRKELKLCSSLCILNRTEKNVIVKNLSKTCHIENIKKLFRKIEKDVTVHIPKKDGKKRPYAFVEFSDKEKVKNALLLSGTNLCGNIITVEKAKGATDVRGELCSYNKNNDGKDNDEVSDGEDSDEEDNDEEDNDEEDNDEEDNDKEDNDKEDHEMECSKKEERHSETDKINDDGAQSDGNSIMKTRRNENDVDEGKTLFITNIPIDATNEELTQYVESHISPHYVYIKMCTKNGQNSYAFVKLKNKSDADAFLKKVGEYTEEKEIEEPENIIEKFSLLRQKKKERKEKIKNILLHDISKIKSEHLYFKNTYLVIKRAIRKEALSSNDNNNDVSDKKNLKKLIKSKDKLNNNIHLLKENDVNKMYLNEILEKRNLKLAEKKETLLKNKNFVINPCRIYIRNYPLQLEQNEFRKLLFKHFTPIFMKKYNLKKKDAFRKCNGMIKKVLVLKKDREKNIEDDKEVAKTMNKRSTICFIDLDTNENAKEMICFLQNRNIYELLNNILYKGKESKCLQLINDNEDNSARTRIKKSRFKNETGKPDHGIYKNRDVLYVDYCIEDVRMLHVKKIKEERFLKHIQEKKKYDLNGNVEKKKTKKTIQKRREKKISRGRRQREKRRLQKMQAVQLKNNDSVVVNGLEEKNKKPSANKMENVMNKKNIKTNEKNKRKRKREYNEENQKKTKERVLKKSERTLNDSKAENKKKMPKEKELSGKELKLVRRGILKILKAKE